MSAASSILGCDTNGDIHVQDHLRRTVRRNDPGRLVVVRASARDQRQPAGSRRGPRSEVRALGNKRIAARARATHEVAFVVSGHEPSSNEEEDAQLETHKSRMRPRPREKGPSVFLHGKSEAEKALALACDFPGKTRAPGSRTPPRRTTESQFAQRRFRRSRVEGWASGIDNIVREAADVTELETDVTARLCCRCIDIRPWPEVDGGAEADPGSSNRQDTTL